MRCAAKPVAVNADGPDAAARRRVLTSVISFFSGATFHRAACFATRTYRPSSAP